jgi:hypothetical protein
MSKPMKILLVVVVCAGVSGAVGWQVRRATRAREYTLRDARIVAIDPANGAGEIEFVHPRTGQTVRVTASMPPECDLTIDGRPATATDIRVGDRLSVRCTIRRNQAVPHWVRIVRVPGDVR